jgi:hypothetical protein
MSIRIGLGWREGGRTAAGARARGMLVLLAALSSCDSDEGNAPGSSTLRTITCEGSCDQIAALRCPDPVPSSRVDTCLEDCAEYRTFRRYADCESLINGYYTCIGARGNMRCLGTDGFEIVNDCLTEFDAANECLDVGAPCPPTAPVDCGVGCCPVGYTCGVSSCVREPGSGGTGGVGGSTGSSGAGGSATRGTGGTAGTGAGGTGGTSGTAGTGAASGAGGTGGTCDILSAGVCESCLEARCCASLDVCDFSSGCLECLQSGSMGPDCSGSTTHFDVRRCAVRECSAECASKGYCNALPDGTCESCLESSCCDALLTCFADATCSGCIDFQLSLCASNAEFQSLRACGNAACGAGCPATQ